MKLRSTGPILLCLATSTSMAFAAGNDPNVAAPMVMPFGFYKTIPFENWKVDSASFIQQLKSTRHGPAKAATDRATVYRPVPRVSAH